MDTPLKLQDFMYALMKEARRNGFMDFIEYWHISEAEYSQIEQWFAAQGVDL